jgi:CRISPR-associated protein Csh1
MRHLARFYYYLDQIGVLPMTQENTRTFQPEMKQLKPYFTDKSGINSDEKAFAFLVGILYGKLIRVQSSKDVNVMSSTLPWLKRLQLSGNDLPELYAKISHKFMTYGSSSEETRHVLKETAKVGTIVGDNIALNITQTCYFLLLGQALAVEILPTKEREQV